MRYCRPLAERIFSWPGPVLGSDLPAVTDDAYPVTPQTGYALWTAIGEPLPADTGVAASWTASACAPAGA